MPAPIPIGTPIRLAINRIKAEPAMALAIPPPASPTGFGVCVRKAQLMDPMPLYTRYPKIAPSGSKTRITAPTARPVTRLLSPRRHRLTGAEATVVAGVRVSDIGPRRGSAGNRPDQKLGQNIHDNRDDEQCQAYLDQSAQVNVASGLGKLIGDHTSHGVARGKQGACNLGTVSDDHGDSHGFAEGTA